MNSAFVQVLTAIAMVLTIVVPMTYYFKGEHNKNRYKKSLAANVSGFFGLLLIATVVSFAGATTASAATEAGAGLATGLGYIGAALVTGLSGIGSGIAVASMASTSCVLDGMIIRFPSTWSDSSLNTSVLSNTVAPLFEVF